MPRKETYAPLTAQGQQDLVSEGLENLELPMGVVMKIAKASIPDNVKLQKETVLSLVKSSTVFINNLAETAYDVAQSRQHKSISASDVLKALETIEFSDMVNTLQAELLIYRELSKNDKGKKSTTTNGSTASAKKGLGAAGASASASIATKGKGKSKSKEKPTGVQASTASNSVEKGAIPIAPPALAPGPFTSAPLDLPTAHSPMDVVYPAESVSARAAPPISGLASPIADGGSEFSWDCFTW
ncbi:hypothetical protein M413DRAFT_443053 [Hebeloma cylindrosporum]|uniref:DNA polymerase epsilon subunit D n=1 Tax=Hebeloma cylindrosporum TaxID=76867 RepID=A0A0C3C550_HEBCY|nr:hypothetical protein M413DRAFT_443053 [Hebeloma cylindrosporum h7]